jgi:hypothetical protein
MTLNCTPTIQLISSMLLKTMAFDGGVGKVLAEALVLLEV